MARNAFVLVQDVWTDLGTGLLVVTVKKVGEGPCFINSVQVDATADQMDRAPGAQFHNNAAADTVFVKAAGPGWEVIADDG